MAGAALSHAAPLNAVNQERLRGCGADPTLKPLYYSVPLSAAAARLAAGASLERALADSGYVASRSSLLHLSGAAGDTDIERILGLHYCALLKDPAFHDFGVEQRGRELYMLLAVPALLPKPAAAAGVRREIFELVNAARAQPRHCGAKLYPAVGSLALDDALTRAASLHSTDMAEHEAFDHAGTDGSTPAQRVEQAGYGAHRIVGENIAAGAMSAAEVMQGWLASPAHCENIMDGRFTQIGIAFAENRRSAQRIYWTQDFAAPR